MAVAYIQDATTVRQSMKTREYNLTVNEFARRAGLTPDAVRKRIERGSLKSEPVRWGYAGCRHYLCAEDLPENVKTEQGQ